MGIAKPKVRRRPRHAPVQFALIEDDAFMTWLRWLTDGLGEEDLALPLWPGPTYTLRKRWDAGVAAIGCSHLGITPGGLRSGGATHHWLLYRDLPELRRRGRWQHEKTVEIYLQECMFTLQAQKLEPSIRRRVADLAALAPALLQPPLHRAPPMRARVRALGRSGQLQLVA